MASVTMSIIGCVKLNVAPGFERGIAHPARSPDPLSSCPGSSEYGFSASRNSLRLGPNGSVFGILPAGLRSDQTHLGRFERHGADFGGDLRRFVERDARGRADPHPDDALVEFSARTRCPPGGNQDGAGEDRGGDAGHRPKVAQQHLEDRLEAPGQPRNQRVAPGAAAGAERRGWRAPAPASE